MAVLTDDQWEPIYTSLPSSEGKTDRPFRDDHSVVEGILCRYRCRSLWRDIPEQSRPWRTVWKRHRRYSADGAWGWVMAPLPTEAQAVEQID